MDDDLDLFGEGIKDNGSPSHDTDNDDKTDIDGGGKDKTDITDDKDKDNKDDKTGGDGDNKDDKDDKDGKDTNDGSKDSSTGELEVGQIVEFEGKEYTVAENGDLVDAEGNVFKKADEVKGWIDSLTEDTDEEFDVNSVINAIGVEIKDEAGKPVEFTNDLNGVVSYVKSVLDIKARENQEGAINKFFNDVPVVKEFVDYLTVNNGDPTGFGEIRDRSGIVVDKDNVEQQKAIIKVAAKEFGNTSLSDAYIKYLEESGNLYNEAVSQLQNIQNADLAYKKEIEKRAEEVRQRNEADRREYWANVEKVIKGRVIGGYKIPDSFVKDVDGKKMTFTAEDFLDYVSQPKYVDADNNKITGYQRDLDALSEEDLLNSELLDAWIKFTGGSYKDLVQMAINQAEVKRLKLVAKQKRTAPSVRTPNKQNTGKGKVTDIAFD